MLKEIKINKINGKVDFYLEMTIMWKMYSRSHERKQFFNLILTQVMPPLPLCCARVFRLSFSKQKKGIKSIQSLTHFQKLKGSKIVFNINGYTNFVFSSTYTFVVQFRALTFTNILLSKREK